MLRTPRNLADPAPSAAERGVRQWLDAFSSAVRRVDYDAGRELFADDVVGFGTVGIRLKGLDTLVDSQWQRVWGVTSDFHFDMSRLDWGADGDLAWAAVAWSSQGHARDGRTFIRRGRATYVLQNRNGRWLAVHSHHSIDPSGLSPDAESPR